MTLSDTITILPLVVLTSWAVLLLLVDLWIPKGHKGWTALLCAAGLSVSLGLVLSRWGQAASAFNGMVEVDGFASFLDVIFLVSGLGGVALAYDYLKRMDIERGEYYSLLLITISGMMLMASAYDLITIFLALELLSIPLYVLAGFVRLRSESEEAALKYFLLGAFSTGFVLYGTALIYGATSFTGLGDIVSAVSGGTANMPLFLIGAVLLLVGFAFKSAIVPFHMWTPDVYQGAPSPVTAFMSIGAKGAGFAALMRVFIVALPDLSVDLTPILWGLAALTMIIGNVVAINQKNIKRLLAYSSIAQAGYMLMAFVPYGQPQVRNDSVATMLFFLAAYSLTTLGSWAVIIAMEKAEGKGLLLEDYAGLGRKHLLMGLAMSVFMFSFTGVPLTLGFWGKFYLFSSAIEGGFLGLALIGLGTSVISAFYYLRVVVIMFMRPGEPEVVREPWLNFTILVSALAVVGLAFVPWTLLDAALKAIIHL